MLRDLGIRARIALLQTVLVVAVLAMAAAATMLILVTDWHERRVGLAQQQLAAAAELTAYANRYSEQIAELLLLGDEELPDFQDARAELERGFAVLDRLTAMELDFLSGRPGRREGRPSDTEHIARARALFGNIDRAVERVLALRAEGRQADAISLFRTEIETRLDADLDGQLRAFVEDERDEALQAETAAARGRSQVAAVTGAVSLLALVVTLVAGWRLRRSLVEPIAALAEAATAVGRGELAGRVRPRVTTGGELGLLADRFDAMAAQLEEQRDRLLRARDGLGEEVRHRTAELEEANRRLREMDRARVDFLADLSHELRTPLTVLRGEAEIALRAAAPPDAATRALDAVVRQAAQMERLVGDLLFLARSQADLVAFTIRTVALQEVVADAVEEGAALSQREPQDLLGDEWPEAPILIEADPPRLKQAILIGIDNALKYGDPTEPVGVTIARTGPGQAEVVVSNAGPGLVAEELSSAFSRFFRGSNARGAEGSGLGLSIAKWIAERHGGTVSLASRPEGPTEFRLRLPTTAEGTDDGEDTAGGGRSADRELRAAGT